MEKKVKTAPYLPYATFTSALDSISAHGVPNIIDRHSFPSFSGASVSAALVALKFFGLIDEDGKPDEALEKLAVDKVGRKTAIKALLEKHYTNVFALNLAKATPPQFDEAFTPELYGITGETKTKAKTFFIKAAQFTEIPISKLLLKNLRASGPRKKGKSGAKSKPPAGTGADATAKQTNSGQPGGTERTITLENGGTATLSLNVNLLELRGKDRRFVFHLIDAIEAYAEKAELPELEAEPETSTAEGVSA